MTRTRPALPMIFAVWTLMAGAAGAQDAPAATDNITAVRDENGRYYTADDVPTFNIAKDGTVDWMTYSGFRRYHSECHVCHGPEGEGSSYAPALKKSAITMDYYAFIDVVTNGRKKVNAAENSVMPAFGQNVNVMCYLDDIYTYLKARGADALPRGRPAKKEPKSDAIRDAENDCLGRD
ncbi:c-type cytochrome, methanol metabolism-related [Sinorhizobium fredii]|uniref:C-type cytochrome, methanol metabolism-related n=1 Tax=Rhizobium fredii TaxID=380 RepID=A0A844AIX2_RHIFR|nr:c-type cytochrome, methanol metabolism-related [Sinorhizobium fredii]MQX12933.1 c-type cytochrome, methanol metabolism-related [Sinorhizobium fredii]WOS64983.1 c-type cytochrome, methanol metabolism-related [Sinorhizobium fredii GR64]GEC33526.1 c-type cytochrome, methanol metabolism-related [Sinorhizobium fredii]GLS11162.1 c-type cytochrome, methanol metabolism-related [Sinorhizobium fredii]